MKRLMAESIREFRMPRYGELPNMGLYLEQTVKYMNHCLSPLRCLEVTPSMVSNYVKQGVVCKPVKKQYYAEHIAYLFFVVLAKSLCSIDDVGMLISLQKQSYSIPVAYDYLCDELENALFFLFGLKDKMDALGQTDSDEKDLLHNLVFSAAHVIHVSLLLSHLRGQPDESN